MGTYSFRLADEDKRAIQAQMEMAGKLIQQRDQIQAQIAHEVGYANTIWRAACLSAQLSGHLPKDCDPNHLVMPDGSIGVRIDQEGIASWESKDTDAPNRRAEQDG